MDNLHNIKFGESVARYCKLIDSCDAYPVRIFLMEVRSALSELVYLGLNGTEHYEFEDEFELPPVDWEKKIKQLEKILGDHNHYCRVYDTMTLHASNDNTGIGSLADDLTDIWCDITPGFNAWATAEDKVKEKIVDDWLISFHAHWLKHALWALIVIDDQM